jgi:integrase
MSLTNCIGNQNMDDHTTLPAVIEHHPVALPADLVEAARDYARASHARRTQETYSRWWADFTGWCSGKGLQALPAAPQTVAVWLTALARGDGRSKPLAVASIRQALSALVFFHRDADHTLDRKSRTIARTMAGISREKAKTATTRKARALLATDLRDILEKLTDKPIDVRDGALLALGWAGALRRSELVGLDWLQLGTGTGFVVVDERGITIRLMTSKSSQDAAADVTIPAADMPAACRALQAWAVLAGLEPGSPVFRAVDQHSNIASTRLCCRAVSHAVKRRMRRLEHGRGKTKRDVKALMAGFSGHSLRSGFATSAAGANVPAHRIQRHTRHKSIDTLNSYIREADRWVLSALKGGWAGF